MLENIRQVFLKQYIGAIVIALLVVDAITSAIALITSTATLLFTRQPTSVLMQSYTDFDWGKVVIPSAVKAALFALAAYGLARWLYVPSKPEASEEKDADAAESSAGDVNAR